MSESLTGKTVLVTVSGPDHPGITSELMAILSETNEEVLDMGQAVTQGLLSLSVVIKLKNDEEKSAHIIKELLFLGNRLNISIDYKVIDEKTNQTAGDEKFILSCVSIKNIGSRFIHEIAKVLADHNVNILRIDKVSPSHFKSLEFATTVPADANWETIKKELLSVSTSHSVDVAFLKDNVFRRSKRLIVFDMDSTLIQTEVIDEMAEAHGVGDQVKAITERAMNGEINFDESLLERVALLKGLEVSKLDEILKNLPLTSGVEEFVKTVKSLGYRVALISGGFSYFANSLKDKLNLDYAFSNELQIKDGKLTGNIEGTIVNAEQKALILKMITQQENINLEQTVAIGDGANDLPMLSTAGLGIAYHAKDIVKKEADQNMSHGPMTTILYFLGIPGPA